MADQPLPPGIKQMILKMFDPKVHGGLLAGLNPNKSLHSTGKTTEQHLQDVKVQRGPPVSKKNGGKVKASSASKRADGCAVKGKTRGKVV